MGKKLEGNPLFDNGRLKLTDERKREEMERMLSLSLREHVRVTVVWCDSVEELRQSGFVTSIHAHSREIKLQWADEWKWIGLDRIMEVYPG
ncbi:YolD-like family protein [Paenibacillus sp. 7124]|uniref:YolD-like family protein n=1 Tax=Paenibacillus apii TaxID=1850370 RepID=A0A6M1PEC2_9BACL|nr:YolD-like family protein [Paenibacillus apii]NGM81709.1 YolD-like family protein [Paenibacillus apii]NJJ41544.1 YolD-like family protein [Paenibacillus apii]